MNFASTEASFCLSEFVKEVKYKYSEEISISEFAKKLKEDGRITEARLRLDHEREIKELAEILEREDCSLERLRLSKKLDFDIKQLFEALGSGKCSLCSLQLENCKVSEESINMMVEGLNRCRLRELTFMNSNISKQGMKELIRGVPMLRFFTIEDAATTEGVAEAIREGYCALEKLNLEKIRQGMCDVVEAIGTRVTQLRSLDLSFSRVGNEGANSLALAIMRGCCPSLQELCLFYCGIEVEGICSLGEAIGSRVTLLRSLDLSCNIVGERGLKSLADAITQGGCVLRELHLWGAQIGSEGICSIANALTNGHSDLHTLDLGDDDDSNIWPKIMPIVEVLKSKHCRLRKLILHHCGIKDKNMNVIVDGLSHTHCKLQNLDIGHNEIRNEGAQKLANALQTGQCLLQNLDLSYNFIGCEGVKKLGDALKNAKSSGRLKIKILQMNYMQMNDDMYEFNLVEKLDCLKNFISDMKRDTYDSDSYDSEDIEEDEALAPPTSNVIIAASTSKARDDISFAKTQDEFKGLSNKGKKPRHIKKEDVPYNEFITVWDPSSLEKENMDDLPKKMHFDKVNNSLRNKLEQLVQQVYQHRLTNHEVRKQFYLAFAYENCNRARADPSLYEVNWTDFSSQALKYSKKHKGRPKGKKASQPDDDTNKKKARI